MAQALPPDTSVSATLNGLAIRNVNRGDSREFRRKTTIIHHVRAIRANRLTPEIRNLYPPPPPEVRFAKKGVRFRNPSSRESGDSRESASRFARIAPSKSAASFGTS